MDDEDEELTGIAGLYKPLKKENHEHRMQGNKSVLGIFSKRYLCSFNDMQTRHPDDLRTFGVRLSGNEVIDTREKSEALLHAEFISRCFNKSNDLIPLL